jgi:iron complex outermembrane receptor protein
LALALCPASAATAQSDPARGAAGGPGDAPIRRLPEVRVTAPAPGDTTPRGATPGRIDTLTGADVTNARGSVLPDVLQRLPGVTLQDEQGNPFQPTLTLRGFTASSVTGLPQGLSVFLDGVRLNEPTAEEVNFDLIPLEDVERIDVIRGPSVLFGRNTLGGTINMVTRRGQEIREIVPEIALGSFGRRDYRLRLGGMARPLDYALSLSESIEDGYRDATQARVSRLRGKLGVDLGDTDVSLSYQFSDNHIGQAGSLPSSDVAHHRRRTLTPDFFAPTLNQAIVNVERTIGDSVTISGNVFVRALDSEQFNANLIGANSRLLNTTVSSGGTVQLRHVGSIADRRNVLIAGVEYTWSDVTSRTFTETPGVRTLAADLHDRQDAGGAYVQDSWTLARDVGIKGSSVVLTVAARWDRLSHDIDDRLGGPSAGVHVFDRTSPRAGVNVNLTERLATYLSYAEGFRAPAFLELTCAGPGAVCPGLQVGVAPDPPLHPVKARSYEVGVTVKPLDWLDADASVFRVDLSDDIFAVAPTGTTGVFFQNIGSTRREGVEVGLRARGGRIIEGFANYAFTRATFQDTTQLATPLPPGTQTVHRGDVFSLVPQHRVNAGLAYHPWPWATLSLDARYVGSQFLRGDEVNRQRPLPAYVVVNAGVSVKIARLETFARVNNVFNTEYETFGTFAPDARQPGAPVVRFLTPAPPINVLVGVQYAF